MSWWSNGFEPQLQAYFPDTIYLKDQWDRRALNVPLLSYRDYQQISDNSVAQLKTRLPEITRNVRQIKKLAEQVRAVIQKEWKFSESF